MEDFGKDEMRNNENCSDERKDATEVENSCDNSKSEKRGRKKKLSTPSVISIVVVCVLAVAFSVFLPIYLKANEPNRELYKNQQIKFSAYGEEIGVYKISDLLALDGVSETEFSAVYDTSNSEPVTKTYTGIELKKVLTALGVDMSVARQIMFKASDGADKIYAAQDVILSDNVFIAYMVEGEPFNEGIKATAFKETSEDGGPFVVIKVNDQFSKNRCKLLTEVSVS